MAVPRFVPGLLLVSALGAAGWFGGKWAHEGLLPDSSHNMPPRAVSSPAPAVRPLEVSASSPEGKWMARARGAASADFPALFEDFDRIFNNPYHGARNVAQKWLLGLWIARDAGAAAAYVAEKKDARLGGLFGTLLAGMAPEKAGAIINGPHGEAMGKEFTAAATQTLAMTDPREYLRAIEKPGKSASSYWPEALGALAAANPREAAALWTGRSTANGAQKALSAVLGSWVQRDPQAARAWVDSMEDPKMRRLAQHAWLTGLAQHDLPAARRALTDFDGGEWVAGKPAEGSTSEFLISDARMEIAALTARTDLARALKDLGALAAQLKPPADELQQMGGWQQMQEAIVEAAWPSLPKEPAALLAALDSLKAAAGTAMDGKAFAGIEAALLGRRLNACSAETALETARLLAARPPGGLEEQMTPRLLIVVAVHEPARAVEFLAGLPEAQRSAMGAFVFACIHEGDPALLARAAAFVPDNEWNGNMGHILSQSVVESAPLVESLPVNEGTGMARAKFGEQWAVKDPEAASRWVGTLPQNDGTVQAARGVAAAWARYDDVSASAWVAGLPQGPCRDGAALGLTASVAASDPEAAWKWAASISERGYAVEAYANVAKRWGNNAPPEFMSAWQAALDAAGLQGEERADALNELQKVPDKGAAIPSLPR